MKILSFALLFVPVLIMSSACERHSASSLPAHGAAHAGGDAHSSSSAEGTKASEQKNTKEAAK